MTSLMFLQYNTHVKKYFLEDLSEMYDKENTVASGITIEIHRT